MAILHVGWELAQSFVEIIHLRKNAYNDDDDEDIGRRVWELVITAQTQFQSNTESFDGHDWNGTDGRAY